MFDSPQCLRPFTGVPLSFDWGAWNWLKLPLILGVMLGIGVGLGWLLRRVQRRRLGWRWLGYGWLAILGLLATLLLMGDRGLTALLPPDPGTPVDAIVILGRGTDWRSGRVDLSAELWRAKRAPLIFVSGINDTPKMLQMLADKGVPASSLDGENCSLTTAENALFTASILQARGMEKIILMTDGFHLWRSLLDFQSQNFQQMIAIASPAPANLGMADRTILAMREYFFLITSGMQQLVTGKRISDWNSPDSQELVALAKVYGKGSNPN